jgi:prepilin-type N-terminal cleavage/methylation domain-containing protein
MSQDKTGKSSEKGFSLLELLLVMIITSFILALVYIKFRPDMDSGDGERAIEAIAQKLAMRRDEAIRLNGLSAATSLENETAPLVVIDFDDLQTTASLAINGDDADGDHHDDVTGEMLTYLKGGDWKFSYRNDALKLPDTWKIVRDGEMNVKPIRIKDQERGVAVTKIAFDADGRVYGYYNGAWQRFPTVAASDEQSGDQGASPFWAVYLQHTDSKYTDGTLCVAVAIYPSGQIEKFRFDGSTWRGWRGRTVE